jgi:hypothetical protein
VDHERLLQLAPERDEAAKHRCLLLARRMIIMKVQPYFANRHDARRGGTAQELGLERGLERCRVVRMHAHGCPNVRSALGDGQSALGLRERADPDAHEPGHASAAGSAEHFVGAFRKVLGVEVAMRVDEHRRKHLPRSRA